MVGRKLFNDVDYHAAEQEFSRAVDYSPNVARYYHHRADARYRLQKFSAAFRDLQTAVSLDPSDAGT
jgi:Tfp pilus assembly protein PilF